MGTINVAKTFHINYHVKAWTLIEIMTKAQLNYEIQPPSKLLN
jgi:hypothetical protein